MSFRPPNIFEFDGGKRSIAVLGLGYVGINVAVHFAKHWKVVGFDIDERRVMELREGYDRTGEVERKDLQNPNLTFTSDVSHIRDCSVFIVCVPTPVDSFKVPDISAVRSATETVARCLKGGDVFILESTVWPGFTREVCIPMLESSGLKVGEDFSVAYSPERVNPGDKEHSFDKVVKVVGAFDDETADFVAQLYARVVKAGVMKVGSLEEAEAAKIIENAQRDINIAFVNEIAMLFDKLGINTKNVLRAALTKWNFLKFEPGLVGGHCIPVDPYYLAHKARQIGFHPQIILAGRRVNDGMGVWLAQKVVKKLIEIGKQINGSKVLVMGLTFKENVPDFRNSLVFDMVEELLSFHISVSCYDPFLREGLLKEVLKESFRAKLLTSPEDEAPYDCVIVSVKHREFLDLQPSYFSKILKPNSLFVDVKGVWDEKEFEVLGIKYISL